MSRSRWISLMVLLLSGCRVHVLEDGAYVLSPTETLRDDCGLAAGAPLEGTLRTEGHLTEFILTQPDLRLIGTYRYSVEEQVLDGTVSNLTTTLNGRQCLVETVVYHLETVTTSPGSFTGEASIQYDTRQDDACSCRYWFRFTAQRR